MRRPWDRETRCAPLPAGRLRAKRRGQGGTKWHADETSVRVDGRWYSRCHALGRDGNLVEALLSKQRVMDAAQRFFVRALDTAGQVPAQVTTDGHDAYPRASRETLGDSVHHRTSRYKNKRIEQDHRGSKQRYCPMCGFGNFAAAVRFCTGFEEQCQYFRAQARSGEIISLADRCRRFHERRAGIIASRPPHDRTWGHFRAALSTRWGRPSSRF